MIRAFGPEDIVVLLMGMRWTFLLSLIAFVGGCGGGLIVALCRTSAWRNLRAAAAGFIDIFQGTPLLMQLFLVYFGVAFIHVSLNPWVAVAIGLSCNASAFLGEIWRGGIQAVPKGQTEAATALGIGYIVRLRYIVLPQAFRISLPATVGFLVQLIKGTSLAAIIGFTELTRAGQIIANATFKPMLVYGIVGLLYFALCWPLSAFSSYLEHRLATNER
jgi:polar amino acid transport system permease protein